MKKKRLILMMLVMLVSVTGAWAQSVSFEHNDWRAQQYDYDFTTTSFYDMFVPTNVSHYYDCNSDWLKNGVANYSGELPEGTDNYQLFLSRMNTDWMAASLFDWFTMTAVTPAYTQYTYTIHFKVECTQQLVTNTIVRAALFDYHGGSNAWLGRLSTPDKYNYFYTAQNDVTSQDQVLGDEICAARMVGTTEPYESTCDVSFTRKSNYGGTLTSVHRFGFSSSRSLGPKSSRCAHRTFLYACVTPHFDGYVKHVVYQPNAGTGSEDTNDIIRSGSIQSNQFTRTGYTFANWNTKADGTGTTYNEGDVITVDESTKGQMTLYAQWVPNSYTVNFNKQGGTDGSDNVIATFDAAMPQIATPTRSGYGFYGYFSEPNGNGTRYYDIYGTSTHAWDVAEDNVTLYACWGTPVSYIDADGSLKYVGQYEPLTNGSTTLSRGWYLVTGTVTTNTLDCEGDVKIILADGAKLTATGDYDDAGIRVSAEGASLTIYGQQNQTGQLIATGGDFFGAGIGGAKEGSGHDITINGGVITANGGKFGSGIGGGNLGTGHNITINGGVITANGGLRGAGIGGGGCGTGHNITINGGTVTATGGESAAGIGGGFAGNGSDITINGGVITAVGGTDASAIGGRFISSNIFVHSSLVLYAGNTNPPTDFIAHTNGVDVSDRLSGKQYVIARKQEESITITFDMQGGTGGTEQITMNEFTEMPTITIPSRGEDIFLGYFSEQNGAGTQYYNADGTSAHYLDFTTNKTLYAYWDMRVPYIDADGNAQIANNVTKITNTSSTLNAGWYVVNGEVSTAGLVCNGAVHLILADGATLTATAETGYAGIEVSDIYPDAAITIYGQTAQTGKLIATGASGAAGIGGGSGDVRCNGQNITINGGIIAAKSLREGAGIGGGKKGYGRHITINRGVIIAESQHFGSAIGGGAGGSDIHIAGNLLVRAGESETSTEIIPHGSEDMATALAGKLYASIEPGAVVVTHYAENMGANYSTYYNGTFAYEVQTEGVTLYTASLATYGDETYLDLSEIEGNILPAGTPVIVRSETETDVLMIEHYGPTEDIILPANSLSGTSESTTVSANTVYTLGAEDIAGVNTLGFYIFAGTTIPAHKAYLQLEPGQSAPRRICFGTSSVGTATGLENANDAQSANVNKYMRNGQLLIRKNGHLYNAQGALVK